MSVAVILRNLSILLLLITPLYASALSLTAEERSYLAQRGSVNVCVDPNWMPFEAIDAQGRYTGVSADFMAEFTQMLGLQLVLVKTESWSESVQLAKERQCDLLPMMNRSPERETYMSFTAPYVRMPVVLISDQNTPYLDGLKSLEDGILTLPAGYIFTDHVRENFPQQTVNFTPTLLESLRNVAKGEALAAMATLPIALYQIEKHGLGTLKIGGHTDFSIELSVAVRNDDPLLASAFSKAVDAMPVSLHDEILARWYRVKVEQAKDYTLLLVLVGILTLAAAFLLYRNRASQRFNDQLAKVNARLSDRNRRLEQLGKRDYLTGIYHRMNMDSELERDITRCTDNGHPLSIILFDLDDFSQINLDHGHPAGDLLLVELSRLIEDRLDDTVYFGRWGGDSFLILCPQTLVDEAEHIAETLNTRIAGHRFSENIHLSTTFIVAACHPHQPQAEMMRKIEQAVRMQKQHTKGQVRLMDSVETINEAATEAPKT